MKSVGTYEAKTHLPRLLSQVEQGESITITRRGKPIARLVPAEEPERDLATVIAEFRAYNRQRNRLHGHSPLSPEEIKAMIEEGRR